MQSCAVLRREPRLGIYLRGNELSPCALNLRASADRKKRQEKPGFELGRVSLYTPFPMKKGFDLIRQFNATLMLVAVIALTLQVAGKLFIRDAWTDLAADVFGKLVRRQQESGAFLLAGLSDNPEAHWFHELVILHAAAGYAAQTEDRALASAVARATQFHLKETQPDHATHQPWGLFAFLWNPDTRLLGEGMLQAAAQSPGLNAESPGVSDLTLMLLADALYCLRLFGI